MTDNGTTTAPNAAPPAVTGTANAAGVNAAEADQSLVVLARHALAVRAATVPAPTAVTISNGPVVLRVDWEQPAALPAAHTVAAAPGGIAYPATDAASEGVGDSAGTGATTFTLTAETVGVFYRSPEPGAAPFVAEGDPVRAGQQVGIVEAMKLMIPVTAGREGVVAEFLVEDGTAVEHGQALIVFEVLR